MDTLYTFWDNTITHNKTESVHVWGLMNSATPKPQALMCMCVCRYVHTFIDGVSSGFQEPTSNTTVGPKLGPPFKQLGCRAYRVYLVFPYEALVHP